MGRRKNNPDLVAELIDGLWDMDEEEWNRKYYSLSSDDQAEVGAWVYRMEKDGERRITLPCEY